MAVLLVGQLVRLERLSISGNQLTGLPETIGSLRNVSDFVSQIMSEKNVKLIELLKLQLLLLNVSKNQLKCLPESIGSCFSLEELQANGTSQFFSFT